MKKLFLLFSSIVLVLILSIFLFSKIFEDRLISAFKKQIIDKTNINIDFEEIHFSIFEYFPYSSFTLDDAKVFYSMHNRKDTLLKARTLCFNINTLNIFKSIYEFPEIIISDGSINVKGEILDTLFNNSNIENQNTGYLVETKSIIINRCRVLYRYENSININFYTKQSSFSGSFLSNSFSIKLNLGINRFTGRLSELKLKSTDFIRISSTVKQENDIYVSENGKINKGAVGLGFSFIYNTKDDYLQFKTFAENISAKTFCEEFFENLNIPISKGVLSYDSFYSINFNNSKSQKLTLRYYLENISTENVKNLSILNLKGKTTFNNDFNQNHTDIENYLIHYNDFELSGWSKIKNLPHPSVLIDTKIANLGEMEINDKLKIAGKLTGNLKVLAKIDDINNLDIKSIKISKVYSELLLSKISISNISIIKNLSGSLKLNDDVLTYKGKGVLLNEEFNGSLVLADFMNVFFNKTRPFPKIAIEMDKLNLDSVLMLKGDTSKTNNSYELKSKIKNLKYKNFEFNDLDISLIYKKGSYNFSDIKLKAFKGIITGSLTYSDLEPNSLSIKGQGLNIYNLFKDFSDFGQTIITSKNISGLISGKVDISYKMLSPNKIDIKSIKMVSNIVIENGKLSGVKQLKRISKFLNMNEVDSFHFNTIHNKIDIENEEIKIPMMDIAANGLNFQVSGKHGFDGEFKYWVKLNLKEILAKKYLLNNSHSSDYEKDNKDGLNLFLNIYGNNESYKVSFDKKSSVERFKNSLNKEGLLLKSILKEEFGLNQKKDFLVKDSSLKKEQNKTDSIHNKNHKKTFKIEWDEIDTTKINNQ